MSAAVGATATLAALVLVFGLHQAPPADAFGTIRQFGQRAEHERITRIALGCFAGMASADDCFEPKSLDQVAGADGTFGAVGAPDSDQQIFDSRAHCDDADFLDRPGYPRSREDAAKALQECVDHLRAGFREGRDAAAALLDDDGSIRRLQVSLLVDCVFTGGVPGRAKCNALQGFGRALHGVQDFYAHSNWADEADPARPPGIDNPPGLNLAGPSPLLDLRSSGPVLPPANFTTGFFKGAVPGQDTCPGEDGRVTHACLNKDKLLIEAGAGLTVHGVFVSGLGRVSDPQTPRGSVQENGLKAVAAAILETRRQWSDFRAELVATYGAERAGTMIRALTRDDP
jgi:hypothetical protein